MLLALPIAHYIASFLFGLWGIGTLNLGGDSQSYAKSSTPQAYSFALPVLFDKTQDGFECETESESQEEPLLFPCPTYTEQPGSLLFFVRVVKFYSRWRACSHHSRAPPQTSP